MLSAPPFYPLNIDKCLLATLTNISQIYYAKSLRLLKPFLKLSRAKKLVFIHGQSCVAIATEEEEEEKEEEEEEDTAKKSHSTDSLETSRGTSPFNKFYFKINVLCRIK